MDDNQELPEEFRQTNIEYTVREKKHKSRKGEISLAAAVLKKEFIPVWIIFFK